MLLSISIQRLGIVTEKPCSLSKEQFFLPWLLERRTNSARLDQYFPKHKDVWSYKWSCKCGSNSLTYLIQDLNQNIEEVCGANSKTYMFLEFIQYIQVVMSNINSDITTIFLAMMDGRFTEIQHTTTWQKNFTESINSPIFLKAILAAGAMKEAKS